ncbi:protein of unknown function [Acetoanaerobium sticklandii]|uniref:Uncharacterized protein n=1 Tax=Acetoanaerobium sticklandii (strain ATCC 12662 / DSM 519 / JCM 1433 / CCUG 9281 / NCIMB 10654 / HF) TaxID=499177 RepID=E3PSV8_ACESD|nr:protein of unknown function [Acetoanaerobium sticklandii]
MSLNRVSILFFIEKEDAYEIETRFGNRYNSRDRTKEKNCLLQAGN